VQLELLQAQIGDFAQMINIKREFCHCPSVLIAEDDDFIRLVNKTVLLQLGIYSFDVGNGLQAVEAVQN